MKPKFITYTVLLLLAFATLAPAQAASLRLMSPNGGERWQIGSEQVITWGYVGTEKVNLFRVLLSTDAGKTYPIVVADNLPATQMSFKWAVKAPESAMAMIKVVAQVSGNSTIPATVEDASDAIFSLVPSTPSPIIQPVLTVASPNGGEIWPIGSTQTIAWKFQGDALQQPRQYQVLLSIDGGKSFPITIASNLPAGTNVFKWVVKAPETQVAVVKVIAQIPVSNPLLPALQPIEDTSDRPFTIAAPPPPIISPTSLVVVSPRGGEEWLIGSTQDIAWKWSNTDVKPTHYMVSLSLDGGNQYTPIAENLPAGTTNFKWTVKGTPSKTSLIKITAILDPTAPKPTFEAVSAAAFSVSPGPVPMPKPIITGRVTVMTPNGGEVWIIGQPVKITWRVDGPMPRYYTVALSIDGGKTYPVVLSPKVAGDESVFVWTAQLTDTAPLKTARIKVSAIYGTSPPAEDTSDADFAIIAK